MGVVQIPGRNRTTEARREASIREKAKRRTQKPDKADLLDRLKASAKRGAFEGHVPDFMKRQFVIPETTAEDEDDA